MSINPHGVRFLHFRRVRNGHKQIALTLAVHTAGDQSFLGMAAVSENDNGSRAKGRALSSARLRGVMAGGVMDWGFRVPTDVLPSVIDALRSLEAQNLIFTDDNSLNQDFMQDYVEYQIEGALAPLELAA